MKKLLTGFSLLLVVVSAPSLCLAQGDSDLSVLKFSWTHYHRALNAEPTWDAPPNYRQRTDAEKARAQIQYGDTIKSQALKKAERDAMRSAIESGQIFTYKVKVQNTSAKTIKNLYWEYQILESASPENLSRRQFFCGTQMKANEQKNLEVFSLIPPTTNVISAKTLGGDSKKPFDENVVINRIEYKDGSIWQRADWSFPNPTAATLATRKREVGEPPCRSF
jgi:hypothetical protein